MLKRSVFTGFALFFLIVPKIYSQADTNAVRRVAEKLLKFTGWPEAESLTVKIMVIDTLDPIAAVTIPYGTKNTIEAWLSKGLLDSIKSDDELAAIVGHELGHTDEYLTLRRKITAPFFPMPTQTTVQEVLDYESSMDHYGIEIMKKAGYDPLATPKVFERSVSALENSVTGLNKVQYNYFHCRLLKMKVALNVPTNEKCDYLKMPDW